MKHKVKNWLEKHERIYGAGLLFVSLCAVAFGGAYLGANTALANATTVVNIHGPDGVDTYVTE